MLTVLGGGGWLPAQGRHTATALLRDGDSAIMLDAGTGVARFMERRELLDGVRRLDILLSHFHLDHIAGLAYLPGLGLCEQTIIWGPGRLLYDIPTHGLLDRVSHEPFHPVPLEQQDIEVRDIPSGELDLGWTRVHHRRQDRHSAPTLGFRFADELTWITDTAYDPDSAELAAGCRLLAHEAWFTAQAPRNPEIHTSAEQAGELAARAGVQRLMLIHLPPFQANLKDLLGEAQRGFSAVILADDGRALDDVWACAGAVQATTAGRASATTSPPSERGPVA
jgi:ribonuclease BN (tRNA processing enzyme)